MTPSATRLGLVATIDVLEPLSQQAARAEQIGIRAEEEMKRVNLPVA